MHTFLFFSVLQQRKSFEVFYQNKFTPMYPRGNKDDPQMSQGIEFPTDRVCHITHSEQAGKIIGNEEVTFLARPKKGRIYDQVVNHSFIYSYKDDDGQLIYQPISAETDLIYCGCFSWWGFPIDQTILSAYSQPFSVPSDAFSNQSIYGGVGFSVELSYLKDAYKHSRKATQCYLKVAGTLRYKREICYVVIACTEGDKRLSEFQDFSLSQAVIERPFVKYNGEWVSWDHYALAFYYPDTQQALTLNPNKVELFQVEHDGQERCLQKFLRKECPDKHTAKIPFTCLQEQLKKAKEKKKSA